MMILALQVVVESLPLGGLSRVLGGVELEKWNLELDFYL